MQPLDYRFSYLTAVNWDTRLPLCCPSYFPICFYTPVCQWCLLSRIPLLQDASTVCQYIFRYLHLNVVNVQRIESQCIIQAAQKDCADVQCCAWADYFVSSHLTFHPTAHLMWSLFYLNELNCQKIIKKRGKKKKKQCMQHILKNV